ncbi:MAG: hypothetical protein E6J90_39765 [Deltaproteobacteria bacterium]|nr:MAG: hypothetical protein E6J90_39765 [Deltaproteobacteria bacterium]
MTKSIEDKLREEIRHAFDDLAPPPADQLLQAVYAGNDDAVEMKMAFAGKPWPDLPISVLSHHRESVIALSGVGYRAYLPAYLTACLANDPTYGADVRGYTLYGLRPLSTGDVHVATAQERVSRLNAQQRAVVADVLRYLVDTWRMQEAADVLASWAPPGSA